MKCPKCGSGRAKYEVSRKKYWHGTKGFVQPKPRENFNAECPQCGLKWNTETGEILK